MDPSARIISHMNKDHHIAVVDYLVVYAQVPLRDLVEQSVQITEVNVKTFTISYDLKSAKGKKAVLVWNDLVEDEHLRVAEVKDIKNKLVAMAKYTASKQGYSHVQVKAYPKVTTGTALFATFFVYMLIGTYDVNILNQIFQKDPIVSKIASFLPAAVLNIFRFVSDRIRFVFFTTYVIHIVEVSVFMIPRVIKYRVPFPQSLVWILDNFIEGYPALLKIKALAHK